MSRHIKKSDTPATRHFDLSRIYDCNRQKLYRGAVGVALALVLLPVAASAADVIWDGSSSPNWSDTANWLTNTLPGSGDIVRFDENSDANLTINNDVSGLSILGFANTSLAANNGVAGPVTITGNAITLGASGIRFGSGNPLDPFYPGPAQANLTVDVDLTLSADQNWKSGGPGTATTAQPGGQQSIILGTSPNGRTVSLNGNRPTVQMHSNGLVMAIINSKLVDGSAPSKFRISKVTGNTTTYVADEGNLNNNPRVRITGDNTYSGGTEIISGRQLIQLGSSTVMSGSTIVSGPLGTGTITMMPDNVGSNDQAASFVAYGADRTLDNPIEFTTTNAGTSLNFASTSDDTRHTLTLNGDITAAANLTLIMLNQHNVTNNFRNGSGDVIINSDITLNGASAILALGQGGTTPTTGVVVGKMTINGNILGTGGSNAVNVSNGNATVPTVVQLNGQNTHATMTVSAPGASSPTAAANVGMGSSSIPDGLGGITSGPLGVGTVTVGGSAANGTTFEALGGVQTIANPFDISTLQTILAVTGSNDLTLTGSINGFGGLAKNGVGKLTVTNTNGYFGSTTVSGGSLIVNGSLSATSGATVAIGATLGGSGTIAGPVTSTGTIAPGSSIGTLNLGLSLTLNDTSSLNFELGAAGSHDLINVGTDLTLPTAGTVTVNVANSGGMGTGTFSLIDYVGALNGDFSTLVLGTRPSGFTYSLINNTGNTSIDLQVTAGPGGVQGDYNGNGVVDGADYVLWRNGGPLQNEVDNPGTVNAADYTAWRARFGNTSGSGSSLRAGAAVPEPGALSLAMLMIGSACLGQSRRVRSE